MNMLNWRLDDAPVSRWVPTSQYHHWVQMRHDPCPMNVCHCQATKPGLSHAWPVHGLDHLHCRKGSLTWARSRRRLAITLRKDASFVCSLMCCRISCSMHSTSSFCVCGEMYVALAGAFWRWVCRTLSNFDFHLINFHLPRVFIYSSFLVEQYFVVQTRGSHQWWRVRWLG